MAKVKKSDQKKTSNGANVGYEAELWHMADALRGSMDAAEYKHVVLGLILLKYISDAFEEQHTKLETQKAQGADPEDPDEYRALNIFWVPPGARWLHLKSQAKQSAIAQLLGTLDDKIELNRRMNETLEAMARAIFKSWFIDFDPVRRNIVRRTGQTQLSPAASCYPLPLGEGQGEGSVDELDRLFPDSFEDSELGEIPEGWEVKKLSDLCSTQYGFTASAVDDPIGPKFLRVTDINKRNWIEWGDVPYCATDPETRASYALQRGDLVVARMADPGKSAIVEEEVDAVFASYLVRLKTASLAHSYYVYGFLKSDLYS